MAPAIPDRWLDYKPVGEIIKGTRFIAFKVPLREHVVKSVPFNLRLDCRSLLDKIPDLGMIIDLTNTTRYYDPYTFQKQGLVYEKLMIPGHEVPKRMYREKFNMLANNFLQANANNVKLIGVHCTHGVNRTGYLISNFMISELKISPQEAIKRVEKARGHVIERQNYRDDLMGETSSPAHYDNSHRPPIDNWRIPQNDSSYIAQSERSLPGNRYISRTSGYTKASSYSRDKRQYSRHREFYDRDDNIAPFERSFPETRYNSRTSGSRQRSSYSRDERQYPRHIRFDDKNDDRAPLGRSLPENRNNSETNGSRQESSYGRDGKEYTQDRNERQYSQH